MKSYLCPKDFGYCKKNASSRIALFSLDPERFASVRFAPVRLAKVRSALLKSAYLRSALSLLRIY